MRNVFPTEASPKEPMKTLRRVGTIVVAIACVIVIAGCLTSASRLRDLHLGMTKEEVKTAMKAPPDAVKGVVQNKFGQTIEVWMYWCDQGDAPDAGFWVYFCDGKLVEWGPQPVDWAKERDRLYEKKFETTGQ